MDRIDAMRVFVTALDAGSLAGAGRRGLAGRSALHLVPLDRVVNLAAMDGNFLRRFNAQPHFVAANLHDDDRDIVVDHDAFILLPG